MSRSVTRSDAIACSTEGPLPDKWTDDVTFTVEDDSLRKKVIKCGVGHIWETLETKNLTVTKN